MKLKNIAYKNQIDVDKEYFHELFEILPSLFTRDQNNELFKTPQIPLTSDGRDRTQIFWQIIAMTILKSTGIQKRIHNREELRRREEQNRQKDVLQKSHENIAIEEFDELHSNNNFLYREKSMRTSLMSHLLPSGEMSTRNLSPTSEKIKKTFRNVFRIKKIFKKTVDYSCQEFRGLSSEKKCWMLFVDTAKEAMSRRKMSFDLSDLIEKPNKLVGDLIEETARRSDCSPVHDLSPRKKSLIFDNISIGHSRPSSPNKLQEDEHYNAESGSMSQIQLSQGIKKAAAVQEPKAVNNKRQTGKYERPRRRSCACQSCGDKTSKNFSQNILFNAEFEIRHHVWAREAKLNEEKAKGESKKVLIASGSLKVEENKKVPPMKKVGTQANLFGKRPQLVPLGLVDRRTSQQTLLVPATSGRTNTRKQSDDSQPSSPGISEKSNDCKSPVSSRKIPKESDGKRTTLKKNSSGKNEEITPIPEKKNEEAKKSFEKKRTAPVLPISKGFSDKKASFEDEPVLSATGIPKLRQKQLTISQFRTQSTSKYLVEPHQDFVTQRGTEFQDNARTKSSQSNFKKHHNEENNITERPLTQMESTTRKKLGVYSTRGNLKILASLKELESNLHKPAKPITSAAKHKQNNHSMTFLNINKSSHKDETQNLPRMTDSSLRNQTSRGGNRSTRQVNSEETAANGKRFIRYSARGLKSQSIQIQNIANIYIKPTKVKICE